MKANRPPRHLFRHRPPAASVAEIPGPPTQDATADLARLPALMERAKSQSCLVCAARPVVSVVVFTPTLSFSARLGAPAGKMRVVVCGLCRECEPRAQADPELIERVLLATARRDLILAPAAH